MLRSHGLPATLVTLWTLAVAPATVASHLEHQALTSQDTPLFRVASGRSGHGEPLTLRPNDPVPTISLEVRTDPQSGWNVYIAVTNFRFAPRRAVGYPYVAGEGHAHVYANNEFIGEMYEGQFHISELVAGKIDISVSLHVNDHRPVATAGKPIRAATIIEVTSAQARTSTRH